MPEVFDFAAPIGQPQWLVKNLFPLGHLCIIIAQSGVGKSFATEYLAGCVAFGTPYLGMDTTYGEALIIDQDTPKDTLKERLKRIGNALGNQPHYPLVYESMQGHTLDRRLFQIINQSSARLVVLDSLHSFCGKSDPNSTTAMAKLSELKAECLTSDRTIIINHHLTEKSDLKLEELMDYNRHLSGMGSSVIKQQCDTEYILAATVNDNKVDKMYLRPIAKRQNIPQKVVTMRFLESDGYLSMEFAGYFSINLTEIESDMLLLMEHRPHDWNIKKIKEETGSKWTEKEIRKALTSLEKKGQVIMSRQLHNLFTYRLARPHSPLPPATSLDTTAPFSPSPLGNNGDQPAQQPAKSATDE